jgi:hypothetical protein
LDSLLSTIEEILEWWEFDGSPIEGKRLMEDLANNSVELRHLINESKRSRQRSEEAEKV